MYDADIVYMWRVTRMRESSSCRVLRDWFWAPLYQIDPQLHGIMNETATRRTIMHLPSHIQPHRATNRGRHAWWTARHNLRARMRAHLIPIAPVRSERSADIRLRPAGFDVRTIDRSYHNGVGLCNGNFASAMNHEHDKLITRLFVSFRTRISLVLSCVLSFIILPAFIPQLFNKHVYLTMYK